jgi:Putative auto-transporter adhesin, head GIN domain
MRKTLWFVPALTLAGACSANAQHGSGGPQVQRNFTVGTFDSVALEGSPDVVVAVGGAPSVRAEGPSEAVERLDIRVENGKLRIGTRRDGMFSWSHDSGHVVVHVTVPSLREASIGGSGDMTIDRAEAPAFNASIGGSGDMTIGALRTQEAHFSIAGSGGIRAAGNADREHVSIAGSGDVALDALQARQASVSLVGSGSATLHATEAVDGSIMGSGDIVVHGTTHCSVTKMGSGDLRCAG